MTYIVYISIPSLNYVANQRLPGFSVGDAETQHLLFLPDFELAILSHALSKLAEAFDVEVR